LAILARNLTTMLSGTGRRKQSLADASRDAWIRFYRPDENSRNSTQNYYVNGSIAALCLDLTIRRDSKGLRSLDDALRGLWQATWRAGRGYRRDDVVACLSAAAGRDLGMLLTSLVDGPLEPDLEPLLATVGIGLQGKERDKPYLGIGFEEGTTTTAFVNEDGPAFAAGIAPGDEILALNGLRTTAERWSDVFQCTASIGDPMAVLTSSRGCIRERQVTPVANPIGTLALELLAGATPEQLALRAGWLCTESSVVQQPRV
jgi:predicted metalloprotease with PDZ domain